MTRHTKLAAVGGTFLAAALFLTGCTNGDDQPSDNGTSASAQRSSLEPIQDMSSSVSDSSSAAGSASSSSDPSAFTAVTSGRPTDDGMAREHGFEALQLYYAITNRFLTQSSVDVELLGLAAREPYLSEDIKQLKAIESSGETYTGESRVELLEAIIGGTSNVEGDQVPYSNAQLLVCEDNTSVAVKDKNGDPVSTGSALRYQTTYIVTWQEDDSSWKVATRDVMRDNEGNPKSC